MITSAYVTANYTCLARQEALHEAVMRVFANRHTGTHNLKVHIRHKSNLHIGTRSRANNIKVLLGQQRSRHRVQSTQSQELHTTDSIICADHPRDTATVNQIDVPFGVRAATRTQPLQGRDPSARTIVTAEAGMPARPHSREPLDRI